MINIKALALYYREKYILSFFALAFTSAVLSLVWIFLRIGFRSADIPLHYTIFFGIDWYGPWYYIFLYPLGALVCGALNFFVGYRLYPRDKYLSYYLGAAAALVSILVLVQIIVLSINIL